MQNLIVIFVDYIYIYALFLLCYWQESLDEVTVKDMLEGDNMYTCSKCQKKVRAEKR